MSTSFLYRAFGIRGYNYVRTEYPDGQVIFTIAQDPRDCRCPACGSRDVLSRGHAERRFRNLPIGTRPTAAVLPIPGSNVGLAGRCARSRSPSPTRGAATPGRSSATPWSCSAT